MENECFDGEIRDLLESAYQTALMLGDGAYSPEQIKMMVIATNMESLVKTFLFTDLHPEIDLDMKKMALGVLGCIDWIRESL